MVINDGRRGPELSTRGFSNREKKGLPIKEMISDGILSNMELDSGFER